MSKTLAEEIQKIKLHPLTETARMLDISDETYFGPDYKDYISNSRLGLINPAQDGSPEKYFAGFGSQIICSDSLIFGSALHEMVLQPEDFEVCTSVERPTAKLGYVADLCWDKSDKSGAFISDNLLSECAKRCDYYNGDINKFKKLIPQIERYLKDRATYELCNNSSKIPIYLSTKQRDSLQGCLQSFLLNGAVQNLLEAPEADERYNEHTILVDVEAEWPDGYSELLSLKSKLDNFSIDRFLGQVIINDVKTTSMLCPQFGEAFERFHYYREFGMYAFMLSQYLQNEHVMSSVGNISGNCLVVETTTFAHESSVFQVTSDMFTRGVKEASILMKLIAHYMRYGY